MEIVGFMHVGFDKVYFFYNYLWEIKRFMTATKEVRLNHLQENFTT